MGEELAFAEVQVRGLNASFGSTIWNIEYDQKMTVGENLAFAEVQVGSLNPRLKVPNQNNVKQSDSRHVYLIRSKAEP